MQTRFNKRIQFETLERRLPLAAHMVADATTLGLPLVTREFTEYRGELYFTSADQVSRRTGGGDFAGELWKTDGTASGTTLVHEFVTPARPVSKYNQTNTSWPTTVEAVGDELLIGLSTRWPGGSDDSVLIELFVSDGTSEGTTKVKTILDWWPWHSCVCDPTVVDDKLFFTVPHRHSPMWISDGTPDGTRRLASVVQGRYQDGFIEGPNGNLYFAGLGRDGIELWRSDGTVEGTVLVDDVERGPGSSNPHRLLTFGEHVLFVTTPDYDAPYQLLRSFDTRTEETSILADMPTAHEGVVSQVGDSVYFTSPHESRVGSQIWQTDATIAGTQPLHNTSATITDIFGAGEKVLAFAKDEAGLQLVSVEEGLPQLALLSSDSGGTVGSRIDSEEGIYFTVGSGDTNQLWKTDGTREGTNLVLEVDEFASPLDTLDGKVTFLALEDRTTHIWQTDGTAEGTTHQPIVRDDHTASSIIREIVNVDGTAFYSVQHGQRDRNMEGEGGYLAELWKSDGSPEGTTRVTDHIFTFPGQVLGGIHSFVVVDGGLIFAAFSSFWDPEVWFSDGTEAGTRIIGEEEIGELAPFLKVSSDPWGELHELKSTDPAHTRYRTWDDVEVWEYDLVENPTTGVLDHIAGGFITSVHSNDITYFVRSDDIYGTELWQRDAAGVETVHDLKPGPNGSFPRNLRMIDDVLFFTANDGVHGFELWTLDQDDSQHQGSELFAQFLTLTDNFGQRTDLGSTAGDYDGDGLVGFSDFLVLSAKFSGVPVPTN